VESCGALPGNIGLGHTFPPDDVRPGVE
jgi:hypothetical protein